MSDKSKKSVGSMIESRKGEPTKPGKKKGKGKFDKSLTVEITPTMYRYSLISIKRNVYNMLLFNHPDL